MERKGGIERKNETDRKTSKNNAKHEIKITQEIEREKGT
jgi:hypothetical protein